MTNKQPVPILTAHMASQFLHFGSWEMPDKLFDPFKASMKAIESGAAVVIDASELEALREALKFARQWIVFGTAPIGWNVDRIDAVISQEKAG